MLIFLIIGAVGPYLPAVDTIFGAELVLCLRLAPGLVKPLCWQPGCPWPFEVAFRGSSRCC